MERFERLSEKNKFSSNGFFTGRNQKISNLPKSPKPMALLVMFQFFVLLLRLQSASAELPIPSSRETIKPDCQEKCADVSIPYPFGIGEGCFLDEWFEITCNTSFNPPKAVYGGGYDVSNISILDGQMTAEAFIAVECSDRTISYDETANLGKFTFSNTRNKFIAIGCNTLAYLELGDERDRATGCISLCNATEDATDKVCSGIGCCEASIPAGIMTYSAQVQMADENRTNFAFNPCSYAFLTEANSFSFSSSYLKDFKNYGSGTVPVVVDWTIGYDSCEEAVKNSTSYACGPNAVCIQGSSTTSSGYRCNCTQGYKGNPYLNTFTGGCQDIDECKNGKPCTGLGKICTNTMGSYNCSCSREYRTIFRKDDTSEYDCVPLDQSKFYYKIVICACLGFGFLLVTSFCLYLAYKKRKYMKLKEELYKQNGGLFLDRILKEREKDTECNTATSGERNSRSIVTIYREKDLIKATNNYHESQILGQGGFGTVYKGTLSNGEVVAIKKTKTVDKKQNEQFINEIVVLSQIKHRNVVQLLGCCLESTVPLLVYEFIANGTLFQHLHETREGSVVLTWEDRLRIAAEVAGSLAYLHAEAIIPIIHRDVKSSNILLDSDYKAKVADFGASRLIPTDQSQLSTLVQGTLGYLDPEYYQSGLLTEKSDVYSFGVLLAELLTGNKAVFSPETPDEDKNLSSYFLTSIKAGRLFAILDSSFVRNDNEQISSAHGHQQMEQIAELARKCLRMKGEKRPTMKEVAMVLHGLMRMTSAYVLDNADDIADNRKEESSMVLLKSAEFLSHTDSITTIGDSTSRGILALETEGP